MNKRGIKITPKQIAYFKNIRFTVYDSGRIIVEGSIHKYWNNGEHNFNDFGLFDVVYAFAEFMELFMIKPSDAWLLCIEYGFNIAPPKPTNLILQNLFFHRGESFKETDTPTEGNYYQAKHDQYRIKIYDKYQQYSKTYNLADPILRIEINYKGVKLRNQFSISTMNDLFMAPLRVFQDDLISQLKQILFYDFTIDHFSKRLLNYSNKNYWRDMIDNKRNSSFKKHRAYLREYTQNNSENVIIEIVQILENKYGSLTQGGNSIQSIQDVLIRTPHRTLVFT